MESVRIQKSALATIAFMCLFCTTIGELRWCNLPNGFVQYDDSNQICYRCSNQSATLLQINLANEFECCRGSLVAVGSCDSVDGNDDGTCSDGVQCDGVKQCLNGSDEMGCRECSESYFSCNRHADTEACIETNRVCDSRKDCEFGLDETGCQYYEGRCDGFLCGKPHERCIPSSQICDGIKQCIDGSDEINCRYCRNQFRCSVIERSDQELASGVNTTTAQCIGSFRVCDSRADCSNGLDESNCFRWMEWSGWSDCNPPAICERTRQRTCVNSDNNEVDAVSCYHVQDYHASDGNPSVERQTEICPACIPPALPTTAPFTTTPTLPVTTAAPSTSAPTLPVTTAAPSTSAPKLPMTTAAPSTSAPKLPMTTSDHPTTVPTFPATTTISLTTDDATMASSLFAASGGYESTTQSSSTDQIPTALPDSGNATLSTSQVTPTSNMDGSTESDVITDVISTSATSVRELRQASVLSFSLIIGASVAAGIILILILCCLLFCCTEHKRRTGKWTPKRRYYKNRPVRVPQMYHDIPIDAHKAKGTLPKTQNTTQPPTLSSFSGTAISAGMDSGIDDVTSTTSSLNAAHHARQLSNPCILPDPPADAGYSRRLQIDEIVNDFPPPPASFAV